MRVERGFCICHHVTTTLLSVTLLSVDSSG